MVSNSNITKSIGKKPLSFYIISGEDEFFISQFIDEVVDTIFGGNPDKSAMGNYDFSEKNTELTVDEVIEFARTQSMFSSIKFVLVKEIYKLKKDELTKLLVFLENIPSDTYVILTTSGELTVPRKKVLKDVGVKPGNIIDLSGIGAADIRAWAKDYLKEKEVSIDFEVLDYIVDESNEETIMIKNEIDKILLFIGDKKEITKDDFNTVRGVDKGYDVWALCNAVMERKEKVAFTVFENIYEDTAPEMILGSIYNAIKRTYTVLYFIQTKQEGKAQKMFFKAYYHLKKQSSNFASVPYVEILKIIRGADKKIKLSSKDKAKTILTIMLQQIFLLQAEKSN